MIVAAGLLRTLSEVKDNPEVVETIAACKAPGGGPLLAQVVSQHLKGTDNQAVAASFVLLNLSTTPEARKPMMKAGSDLRATSTPAPERSTTHVPPVCPALGPPASRGL